MSGRFTSTHNSLETGQASAFAILLAVLLTVFALAAICTGGALVLRNGSQDQAEGLNATSTAIAEANATTLAQNALVTQTIAAMETEAARPTSTSTPTPQPTATEEPTDTPIPPTPTQVEELEATPTANIFGTSIFSGETPTPVPAGGAGGTGTGGGGTLPTTGIGLGSAVAVAFGLLLLLVVSRRLRTG